MYCQSIGLQKRYHMMESRPMVPSLMNCNCNLSRNNSIDTVPLKFSRPRPEALRILETCHMQNHRKSPLYRRPSRERVGKPKKNDLNAHGILGLCNKVHNTVDISSPRISPKFEFQFRLCRINGTPPADPPPNASYWGCLFFTSFRTIRHKVEIQPINGHFSLLAKDFKGLFYSLY